MNYYGGTGIAVAENDDTSESSEEHDVENSFFNKNQEISEMDWLETVPFGDKVGANYGSDTPM